jgi:DNA replication protein DnaC
MMDLRLEAFRVSGVDKRHADRKLADLLKDEEWARYWPIARKIVNEGGMLALLGDRGTGKTQLAVELIRAVCRETPLDNVVLEWAKPPSLAVYARAREIGMKFRECYDKDSTQTELSVVNLFVRPRLLVIDECQERPDKDHEIRTVSMILDKRYASMLPTVLIANCDEKALLTLFGASVADRIKDGGGYIRFRCESFRRSIA